MTSETLMLDVPTRDALMPAARAFDTVAERYDERFGAWLSVAAQRRAVRAALLDAFPTMARVLEIGGGTGDDAEFLTRHGRVVQLTDASPVMVRLSAERLTPLGAPAPRLFPAERLEQFADERAAHDVAPFDGAFTNFAALNCVTDLEPVGRALARLVRPGGHVMLVIFGTCPPGEWIVELARRRPRNMFRRMSRGDVHARLGGEHFTVRYHRAGAVERALAPWFAPAGRRGIGVFVPPSAAEPWISKYPRAISVLEQLDRVASLPLAVFGDHVLYHFVRNAS